MWNRKHGTKKPVSTPQVQVLYNAMLDMMANINVPPAQPKPTPKTMFEPTQPQRPALRRSFENYRQLRAECENEEDWTTLKSEILAADNLTSAQKRLLTT